MRWWGLPRTGGGGQHWCRPAFTFAWPVRAGHLPGRTDRGTGARHADHRRAHRADGVREPARHVRPRQGAELSRRGGKLGSEPGVRARRRVDDRLAGVPAGGPSRAPDGVRCLPDADARRRAPTSTRGWSAAITRSLRSRSVTMPNNAPRPTTSTEVMRSALISTAASRTVASGGRCSGSRTSNSPSEISVRTGVDLDRTAADQAQRGLAPVAPCPGTRWGPDSRERPASR